MSNNLESKFKNGLSRIFQTKIFDNDLEIPNKYLFKTKDGILAIDQILNLRKDENIEEILDYFKTLKNLEGYVIDIRELFSILGYVRSEEELELIRFKRKIKKKDESIIDLAKKYKKKIKEDLFSDELEFEEQLDIEIKYMLKEKEKQRIILERISVKSGIYDVYEEERESVEFKIDISLGGKRILDEIKMNKRMLLCHLMVEQEFVKIYVDDKTKYVLAEDVVKTSLEENFMRILYYPLDTDEYMKVGIMEILMDMSNGNSTIEFKSYKGLSVKDSTEIFFEEIEFLSPQLRKIIPKLNRYFINDFYLDKNIFFSVLFDRFRNFCYVNEENKPFVAKKWMKFFFVFKDKRVSVTINNLKLKAKKNIMKNNTLYSFPIGSEIVSITITDAEDKETLDITYDLVLHIFDTYIKDYGKYDDKKNLKMPSNVPLKKKKLKEFILGFKSGGISTQGEKKRTDLKIIEKDEVQKYLDKGEEVMLYPPPNLKHLFSDSVIPFYFVSANDEYPYLGLKENTAKGKDIGKDDIPYIPMYFKEKRYSIDKNFNVEEIKRSKKKDFSTIKSHEKALEEGEEGFLSTTFNSILDTPGIKFRKRGFASIKDALFEAKGRTKKPIKIDFLPLFKQELYDYDEIPSDYQFETHHKVLEKYFKINIYLFEIVDDRIEMIIPRHKDYYYCEAELYSKCAILFRNKNKNYELIYGKKGENELTLFGEEMNEKMAKIMIKLTETKDLPFFNINEHFPNIISQTLTKNGKLRSINLDTKETIFTPPICPLDVPLSEEIYEAKVRKDSRRDLKSLGFSFRIDDIEYRAYGKNLDDLPVDKKLVFEERIDQKKENEEIQSRILRQIFGVFLLLWKKKNFVEKHCIVIEKHEYKIEYDDTEVKEFSDINNLDLPSYIRKGKIILSSQEMKSRFERLSEYLLSQKEFISLAPPPYFFNKKYFSVSDFTIRSKKEYVFSSIYRALLFLFEERNDQKISVYKSFPDIVTGYISNGKIIYPAGYNLPVNPIIIQDEERFYLVQFVQDGTIDFEQKAVNAILYNWEHHRVNTGFYTAHLEDETIDPNYPKVSELKNITKPCIYKYRPKETVKVRKSKIEQVKYAAIMPL